MFIQNGKRFNPYAPFTDPNGVVYSHFPMERASEFGVEEIPDPVRQDDKWYFNTDQDTAPYLISTLKPIEMIKSTKLADLASLRYSKMVGGTTIGGSPILTDDYSQAKITQAWAMAQINPAYTTDWKSTIDGSVYWSTLNSAQIAAIGTAIGSHVSGCFAQEKVHYEAISALTDSQAVIDYDITVGW